VTWTRLSCHRFAANAVRLQLHAPACNIANFLRTLTLLDEVKQWSLTTLRERLVKIGARIVRHGIDYVPNGRGDGAARALPAHPGRDSRPATAAGTMLSICTVAPNSKYLSHDGRIWFDG
jgi:hypothetical protein